ncbi:MAG: hypothetical protein IPN46_10975 [Saprospiraceae bacterium]|nr:hypothetical protein [Saprospiraceae bacterium]
MMQYIPEGNASILRQILGWLYSLEDIIDPSRLVKVNVMGSLIFLISMFQAFVTTENHYFKVMILIFSV